MPPIKRTKFKLSPDQLLEMFYWLKLIRAFDERLSILVKQGKVRSGVYTGIGQEAIIVGTCTLLRKEDFVCPLHRDLGSFLMKGVEARTMMSQMFAKSTGLSKGRDSALHSGVHELARREPARRRRPRVDLQDGETRQRSRCVFRRGGK
jgi:TPP-dependent pyruvate/acetoin dehydrogenase alpha subunit